MPLPVVTLTLTSDLQNLIRLSVGANEYSLSFIEIPQAAQEIINKICRDERTNGADGQPKNCGGSESIEHTS